MNEFKSELRQPITVLLIQPDVILNFFICEYLEASGLNVFDVATMEEAMVLLKARAEISVVIAEYESTGKTADENYITMIAAQFPQLALIVTVEEAIIPAGLPPSVRVLAKPFEPKIVKEILEHLLGRSASQEERSFNSPMTIKSL
ncbi:hypothetical protein [Phyllobacterium sp. 22552]|uniref:hypothetical protein n=1 Tax=Phyllobacterium sp. 22552 TaxID=3453941 RepID=UPI003F842690